MTAEARKDESAVCKARINNKHVNQKKGRMARKYNQTEDIDRMSVTKHKILS